MTNRTDWEELAASHGWDEDTASCHPDSPAWLAGYRDGYTACRSNWLAWRHKENGQGDIRYQRGHDAGSEDGRMDRQED